MMTLWMLVALVASVCYVQCCPSGCSCGLQMVDCENIGIDSVLYRNVLVVRANFKDSTIDAKKVLKAYPHLQEVTMDNSRAYNCPSDRQIKGLSCSENGESDGQGEKTKTEEKIDSILQLSEGSLSLGVMVFLLTVVWISCRFYFFVNRRLRARQNMRRGNDGDGDEAENVILGFMRRHAEQHQQRRQQQQQQQPQEAQQEQQHDHLYQVNTF